jgi:hypothetical protein
VATAAPETVSAEGATDPPMIPTTCTSPPV